MERAPRASKRGWVLRIAAALLVALPAYAHAASDLQPLAKAFAKAAQDAGVARVCVSAFLPEGGRDEGEGRHAAEQLATELVLQGRVAVVERSRMDALMSERWLAKAGAVEDDGAEPGGLARAEAVVTGSFAAMGNTLELNARLVRLATGEVLAARRVVLRREYLPSLLAAIPEPAPIGAEEAVADAYEFQTGLRYRPVRGANHPIAARPSSADFKAAGPLQDALSDPCADAAERIDELQAGILDLKARYWAGQLRRKGFSAKSLARKPGALITDPGLRLEFYERMEEEASRGGRPLSIGEVKRFLEADRRSFELHEACGL